MRVEYINLFVEAGIKALEQEMNVKVKMGEHSRESNIFQFQGVVVVIKISGDIEDRVIFHMTLENALLLAGILNKEEMIVLDELAEATIQEISNIILSHAVPKLLDHGL